VFRFVPAAIRRPVFALAALMASVFATAALMVAVSPGAQAYVTPGGGPMPAAAASQCHVTTDILATGQVQVVESPEVGITIDRDGTLGPDSRLVWAHYVISQDKHQMTLVATWGKFGISMVLTRTPVARQFFALRSYGTRMKWNCVSWSVQFRQIYPMYQGAELRLTRPGVPAVAFTLD
jgi:hypothetical protein